MWRHKQFCLPRFVFSQGSNSAVGYNYSIQCPHTQEWGERMWNISFEVIFCLEPTFTFSKGFVRDQTFCVMHSICVCQSNRWEKLRPKCLWVVTSCIGTSFRKRVGWLTVLVLHIARNASVLLALKLINHNSADLCVFYGSLNLLFSTFFTFFKWNILNARIPLKWISSRHLLSANPPTVLGQPFWNFRWLTNGLKILHMLFFTIPKLYHYLFIYLFCTLNLDIF